MAENNKTSVRVYCRVRPPSFCVSSGPPELCAEVFSNGVGGKRNMVRVTRFDLKHNPVREYKFHEVFGEEATQRQVFDAVTEGMVDGLFRGVNAAIIACGQTGSGKTHSMMGPNGGGGGSSGIMPQILNEFFTRRPQSANVTASFFEIYHERVFDLLADWRQNLPVHMLETVLLGQAGLTLMQGPLGDLLVKDATSVPVTTAEQALMVFETGRAVRMAGSTCSNHYSSRSHAIFLISTNTHHADGTEFVSQLYLCDLAGSERIGKTETQGVRKQEAGKINLSILTLGRVIAALTEPPKPASEKPKTPRKRSIGFPKFLLRRSRDSRVRVGIPEDDNEEEEEEENDGEDGEGEDKDGDADEQASQRPATRHVPYRDSKLTRFLVNALGGNGMCTLLMCVSPDMDDACETEQTLQLGVRSQQIQNVITVNSRRTPEELERQLAAAQETIERQQADINSLIERLRMYESGLVPSEPLQLSAPQVPLQSGALPPRQVVKSRKYSDLESLPLELREYIFSFVTGIELAALMSVSSRLSAVAKQDSLWLACLRDEFPNAELNPGQTPRQAYADAFQRSWRWRTMHSTMFRRRMRVTLLDRYRASLHARAQGVYLFSQA